MSVCLTEEPEIMISYKWINVMYLKMKRIKLLLNNLSAYEYTSKHRQSFSFYFLLEDWLSFKKKKEKKPISNKDEIEILLFYLTKPSFHKQIQPLFCMDSIKDVDFCIQPQTFFHLSYRKWDWNLSSDKNLRRFKLQTHCKNAWIFPQTQLWATIRSPAFL